MAEWVDEVDSTYTLTVGSLRATVQPYTSESFEWRIRHTDTHDTLERWTAPLPLDEAKADAEQALREMHDALSKHFAPVLRWEQMPGGRTARLGKWLLEADAVEWTVWADSTGPRPRLLVAGAKTQFVECAVNRSAAEAALRSLGVAFRTEGER